MTRSRRIRTHAATGAPPRAARGTGGRGGIKLAYGIDLAGTYERALAPIADLPVARVRDGSPAAATLVEPIGQVIKLYLTDRPSSHVFDLRIWQMAIAEFTCASECLNDCLACAWP